MCIMIYTVHVYVYLLWFNLSLVEFYFLLLLCMVTYDNKFETKEIKFNPRIKLNNNIFNPSKRKNTFLCRLYIDQNQKMTAYLSELTAITNPKKSFSFHEMINFIAH